MRGLVLLIVVAALLLLWLVSQLRLKKQNVLEKPIKEGLTYKFQYQMGIFGSNPIEVIGKVKVLRKMKPEGYWCQVVESNAPKALQVGAQRCFYSRHLFVPHG